jgi:F0F1-type ATP synthase membrane subunit b/b'
MKIDPEISIVVSFLFFVLIFAKKIYPYIVNQLDDHIESVKKKIHEAERLKNEASQALSDTNKRKKDVEKLLEINRAGFEEKIKKLSEENEKFLKQLRERHEAAFKAQIEAEFASQKSRLMDKLADLMCEKLSEKITNSKSKKSIDINKKDICKLLDT